MSNDERAVPSRRRLNMALLVILVIAVPTFLYVQRLLTDEERLRDQRNRMVVSQIAARGISTPTVLAAMRKVPRHLFVPDILVPRAYADHPLPIGRGQTISQPYIVALMTDVLQARKGMKVLEVGTGSGYQAAVLAELGCDVFTIEIIPDLAKWGKSNIQKAGYKNVKVRTGNGYNGWPEYSPFDAIIVTCAPESIPRPLISQLKEGGRMIIPVGPQGMGQSLTLVTKRSGKVQTDEIIPVRFVPMVGATGNQGPQ